MNFSLSRFLLAAAIATGALQAHALQIASLTPQGEVSRVRQIVARFDAPAVNFGDAKAAAPLALACSDAQATQGTGRWNSEREWVFVFQADLPPGVSCAIRSRAGFRSPKGDALAAVDFRFTTGGPFVQDIRPSAGSRIDEAQFFMLRLNGAAAMQSIADNVWCAVEGLGERVPVRTLAPPERASLLKAMNADKAAARDPLRFVTLACNRRLAPNAKVQLVYGKGVATPGGVANSVERRFNFKVREPFAATFGCERENAQAACLPLRPITLAFNAPVSRQLAAQIRLKSAREALTPSMEGTADAEAVVEEITFKPPLAESAQFTLELPKDFKDASGRALHNADRFPLKVATAAMPPLAKFPAASFGIVERFAEPGSPPLLPVTLRSVEASPQASMLAPGKVSDLQPKGDAEIIQWFRKVRRYNDFTVTREMARRDVKAPLPKVVDPSHKDTVQTRMVSLLGGQAGAKTLNLPAPAAGAPRPFEVVGIPLAPGFHVLEIASQVLGKSLLDGRHGEPRTMYVRTSALVTNLGVHFKLGRENSMAWVTTLDKGQVVPNAAVRVSDCDGRELASGTTDAQGIVQLKGLKPEPPRCPEVDGWHEAYFVSARAADDMSFTWSDWAQGIEPWRFNVPTSTDTQPDARLHTVMDRTLLRAGETLSMKHIARVQTRTGFGLPENAPAEMVITHRGSGQQFTQKIAWRKTATGGLSAESTWQAPPGAKLGQYEVTLKGPAEQATASGYFRVEEFRLPVFEGRVSVAGNEPLVNSGAVPAEVQVNYVSGGPAAHLPVRVTAAVRPRSTSFPDYDEFSFNPPRPVQAGSGTGSDEEEAAASTDQRVIADKLPVTLDRNGAGKVAIPNVPVAKRAQDLVLEASYADPNGEVQTLRSVQPLWPAAVVAAIKTEGWVSAAQRMRLQALALRLDGKPAAGVPLDVRATARIVTTSRKRMVGGFYTYDNRTEVKDLGSVCSGKSDARGMLLCEVKLEQAGEVELVATAKDARGATSEAASAVWVTKRGEVWFGGENHDRMDVLPEKKAYQPGETARLQVRMPFRFATALVAVEREGIVDTKVVQLNGRDPTVTLQVKEGWGPNVYVSVLALRGRLREVPWYSFFTWGLRAPREWWTAFWFEGREYTAPTALVDLSKPAFRLGLAELRVGTRAHELAVAVKPDKEAYPVRGKARVTVSAKLPNGQPAANAEVALAAVDQALLELMPNDSWNLLSAMLQRRAWGVQTSTAQGEIIGRRHYGRKAVPAGGGGGKGQTRELLDTLLLWNPRVVLDAAGQAVVEVPINDALTTFRIAAVADSGTGLFGTGQATIRSTQDLQIISGLPPLVREDDSFRAQLTLRNTTAKAMKVEVAPRATLLALAPQTIDIPPNEAREVAWNVKAPPQLAATRAEALLWEIEAKDTLGGARDALKARQRLLPAVPLTVQQATLVQLDPALSLDVQPPADAIAGRGGLKVNLVPKLADGLPGVRDWFVDYPFTCLEQKASKSIGLRDPKLWQGVVAQLPTYLDRDGLASYFPPRDGETNRGSDVLTAYLLATAHEASGIDGAYALPDDVRAPMERGLIAFVEGRIQRESWNGKDLDVRKLAALEALSRHGKAQGRMVGSIAIAPNQWPTHAVIDWVGILRRVGDVPQREQRLAQAMQVLKARLSFQGTKATFSTEREDYWWWLMQNGDVNTARLLLTVMDDPAWKDDMGRLAAGFIARQQRGAWLTTTANVWGGLALEKFSAKFESAPVGGSTRASTASATASADWRQPRPAMFIPWAPRMGKETLAVTHQGTGKPWLTLQSVAAVDLKAPFDAGYSVKKTITPVEQAVPGKYSRGDVLRVAIEIAASADMAWVVVTDPIPGGSTLLGGGLARDSQVATSAEKRAAGVWPAYEERSFESWRGYYERVPKGTFTVQYTLRLNNVGEFALPPTRAEAMYAPEMFGEAPNARMKVEPGR
ncbi:alpha-2-macroglobulin family protein [Ramlibacter sp.]|uniref:alpha-2-macroglobulin family protein n=1 Tax=Ramlibacter sp. TaxID=1917967 RepID=UPI003D0D0900